MHDPVSKRAKQTSNSETKHIGKVVGFMSLNLFSTSSPPDDVVVHVYQSLIQYYSELVISSGRS